jgi:hypothetical protein
MAQMTDEATKEYVALRSQAAALWSRIDELTALILSGNEEDTEWLTVAALEAQAKTIEGLAHDIYNSPDFWAGYKQASEALQFTDGLGDE